MVRPQTEVLATCQGGDQAAVVLGKSSADTLPYITWRLDLAGHKHAPHFLASVDQAVEDLERRAADLGLSKAAKVKKRRRKHG